MNKLVKAAAALLVHTAIKKKAVKKAVKEAQKKASLDKNFYVSFRVSKRPWQQLSTNIVDQETKIKVLKLKSVIKNFGGKNLKVIHSESDTRIYFEGIRSSIQALRTSANNTVKGTSVGEVKVNK